MRHGSHVFGGMLIGAAIILAFSAFSFNSSGCLFAIVVIIFVVGIILAEPARAAQFAAAVKDTLRWTGWPVHRSV